MNKSLDSIRESYDRIAAEYARRLFHELDYKPFDRQLLDRFVAQVAGRGDVCDMGCGPGHVARYLHDAGIPVFGLDLSTEMVDQAQRLSPDIAFRSGNMLALDLANESLVGIAAFYAIVNLPQSDIPLAFREMRRVLKPGGVLLLAFHVGDETVKPRELWGLPVSLEFRYLRTSLIGEHLMSAGLSIEGVYERAPYAPEIEHQSQRAYVFARRLPD
ncbi:MAG TPA: class I SAM-dependent methyltransferase [Candidatus Cybelea sp.]|jgi:SAM-dependent methyltransferase|nr:class I SAM-dependent methyltransferase [Candidatus Cybelea sp.]